MAPVDKLLEPDRWGAFVPVLMSKALTPLYYKIPNQGTALADHCADDRFRATGASAGKFLCLEQDEFASIACASACLALRLLIGQLCPLS